MDHVDDTPYDLRLVHLWLELGLNILEAKSSGLEHVEEGEERGGQSNQAELQEEQALSQGQPLRLEQKRHQQITREVRQGAQAHRRGPDPQRKYLRQY